jgi:DNA (cytosine-5)-methyltransferase 1
MIDLQPDELIIDSFAGGGGASLGIYMATGRHPDVAINHDEQAVALHKANHPTTLHLCQSVWRADPQDVRDAAARHRGLDPRTARVGLFHASPDCKHFSKAKGGQPREKHIRDLAWVVVAYAERVRPRIITLENVEEFQDWGPLIYDAAGNGFPDAERKGVVFKKWVRQLKQNGYSVEYRLLRACDYGAPTIRKRLFLIARNDGRPIVWPAPSHAKPGEDGTVENGLKPWRTAAEIVDWSLPTPSIFLGREEARKLGCKRPLADATLARIARGVQRYVLQAARPFLVQTGYGERPGQAPRALDIESPLGTVVAGGAKHALVAPHITKFRANATGHALDEPLATVTANSHTAQGREGGAPPLGLVTAFLAQHNTGMVGHSAAEPVSTVTITGSHQNVVAVSLAELHGSSRAGRAAADPLASVLAGGQHQAVIAASLVHTAHGERDANGKKRGKGERQVDDPLPTVTASRDVGIVAAFLAKYYGEGGQDQPVDAPAHTIPTKARLAAVTVTIDGIAWTVIDIGMRMLTPRELFRAQGFPDSYIIDALPDGTILSKAAQIRLCGNSVCPDVLAALLGANLATIPNEKAA